MTNEIVLLIKRNYVELFYCQNNTEFRYFSPDSSSLIPLCFFSDGNTFDVGEKAKIQVEAKNKQAYSNYFELIKKVDDQFNFIGNIKQPIKNLIVRGTEFLINNFLKNVLYSSENVYDLKSNLKFNLIFHNDINENEINFVSELFVNEGFTQTNSFSSNYLVLNYLDTNRKIGSFKGYITVDAIGNNLNLSFYDSLIKNQAKIFDSGKNLATRPEINVIANELCEKAIDKSGSLIDQEDEISLLTDISEKALNDLEKRAEIYVDVVLSDGASERVKLKRSIVREKASYFSEFSQDLNFLHQFVSKTHLQQTDFIIVLNKNVKNQTFVDKIRSTFPNDYLVDVEFIEILELFNNNPEIISRGNLVKTKSTNIADKKEIKTVDSKSPDKKSSSQSKSLAPPPPPPPPPPIGSIASRDRSKKKIKTSEPKSNVKKVRSIVPPPPPPPPKPTMSSNKTKGNIKTKAVPPPPPPPPPITNIKTRSKKKPLASESTKTTKVKSVPPPIPKSKDKKNKAKAGPPPLPKTKKK